MGGNNYMIDQNHSLKTVTPLLVNSNTKIILAVCGSIAAYKAAALVRLLIKAGAEVQVIMTAEAANFITPLTLATLSKKPVLNTYYHPDNGVWNNHVELGLWADLMIIAPASANTLAKMANGLCDNLLTAVYLSAKCTVCFAPAMDLDMWKHPATLRNIAKLQSFGNILIKPGTGELASGLHGEGRMAEPEEILDFITEVLQPDLPLSGLKALVTAGPTYEAIDPVRFIGNHSSGKMGFAIADRLAQQGAEVVLIVGPSALKPGHSSVKQIDVTSTDEMLNACLQYFATADITVMSAAVADYTPVHVSVEKMKKQDEVLELQLKKTTDILAALGRQKRTDQLLVGFALETNNEEAYATEKLRKKNLDFIVLNSMKDAGAGFKGDTNKITIIDRNLQKEEHSLKTKTAAAADICNKIILMLNR